MATAAVSIEKNSPLEDVRTTDLSDPTQMIDVTGPTQEATESADFVVPTRVLIPRIEEPDNQNRVSPPIQDALLSAELLDSKDIVPFNPPPEPEEPLMQAPSCPVNDNAEDDQEGEAEHKDGESGHARHHNSKSHDTEAGDSESDSDGNDPADSPPPPPPSHKKKQHKK